MPVTTTVLLDLLCIIDYLRNYIIYSSCFIAVSLGYVICDMHVMLYQSRAQNLPSCIMKIYFVCIIFHYNI